MGMLLVPALAVLSSLATRLVAAYSMSVPGVPMPVLDIAERARRTVADTARYQYQTPCRNVSTGHCVASAEDDRGDSYPVFDFLLQ
eukprot:3083102-Rhodomonas_salina.2